MRFQIVQGDEQLSSHSGLALIGAMLRRSRIRQRLDAVVLPEHPFPEISHGEVATAMIGSSVWASPTSTLLKPFGMTPFSFSHWNWLQYHQVRPSGNGWTA